MTAIVHLTARAEEWLASARTSFGVRYQRPIGIAACNAKVRVTRAGSCGVEDVRALYFCRVAAVHTVRDGDPIMPTCGECRVRLDYAVEHGPRKADR